MINGVFKYPTPSVSSCLKKQSVCLPGIKDKAQGSVRKFERQMRFKIGNEIVWREDNEWMPLFPDELYAADKLLVVLI